MLAIFIAFLKQKLHPQADAQERLALRLLQQRIVGLVRQRQHGGKHAVLRESEERVVLLHPLIQAAGAGGHSGVLRGRH